MEPEMDRTAAEPAPAQMLSGIAPTQTPAGVAPTNERLDADIDVDLPLVVRFGRAVMPLRALADLGPGSVVDMDARRTSRSNCSSAIASSRAGKSSSWQATTASGLPNSSAARRASLTWKRGPRDERTCDQDWHWAHRDVVRISAAGAVATFQIGLLLLTTRRLAELSHIRERMSRLADGLALLTDTTEAGMVTIREVGVGKRRTPTTAWPAPRAAVSKRVVAAHTNGERILRVEAESLSESEVPAPVAGRAVAAI
jgi:hypothetical protein